MGLGFTEKFWDALVRSRDQLNDSEEEDYIKDSDIDDGVEMIIM